MIPLFAITSAVLHCLLLTLIPLATTTNETSKAENTRNASAKNDSSWIGVVVCVLVVLVLAVVFALMYVHVQRRRRLQTALDQKAQMSLARKIERTQEMTSPKKKRSRRAEPTVEKHVPDPESSSPPTEQEDHYHILPNLSFEVFEKGQLEKEKPKKADQKKMLKEDEVNSCDESQNERPEKRDIATVLRATKQHELDLESDLSTQRSMEVGLKNEEPVKQNDIKDHADHDTSPTNKKTSMFVYDTGSDRDSDDSASSSESTAEQMNIRSDVDFHNQKLKLFVEKSNTDVETAEPPAENDDNK